MKEFAPEVQVSEDVPKEPEPLPIEGMSIPVNRDWRRNDTSCDLKNYALLMFFITPKCKHIFKVPEAAQEVNLSRENICGCSYEDRNPFY